MKHLKYFKEGNINNNFLGNIGIIVGSYLETALWTEGDESNDEEEENELADKSIYDFSDIAKFKAKYEIEWFTDTVCYIYPNAFSSVSNTSIGHDLWLSRNGHGAGFFDRYYEEDIKDLLMYLSRLLGQINLEVVDDKVEFFGGTDKYKAFDVEKYKKDTELKNDTKKYNL